MARNSNKRFVISSFHQYHTTIMTLTLILLMLLLPFYSNPQLAWSQQSPEIAQDDNPFIAAPTEHVQVADINIAYKQFGQGEPILFIPGTGETKEAWDPTLLSQLVAANRTVIIFDNRGMGNTTLGTKPFTIEQFANDTAGLLDALHIEKADVFGLSLGSFVAQELALNYPQKVDRLILASGFCGGNETIYPSEQTSKMLMTLSSPELSRNMTMEQHSMIFAQLLFPPQWLKEHPDFLKNFTKASPLSSVSPEMIQRQAIATTMWKGTCDRLGGMTQRTLVIVGDQDLAAPPINSAMMAQRIPHSWLVVIQGTGHGIMWQVPDEYSAIVKTFLETVK
jgi:pimeloyl-ACP methyl ester carboxylesterase